MTSPDTIAPSASTPTGTAADAGGLMSGVSVRLRLMLVALMPLFLMGTLIICFVGAGHAPTPYKMPIVIAGSEQATEQITTRLTDQTDEDAFVITTTTSSQDARDAVEQRDAVGAIVISDDDVVTYYATGGGALQASLIRSIGTQIADALQLPSSQTDLAAAAQEDPAASSIFFFMVACALSSFLSIVSMSMSGGRARLRVQLAAVAGSSVVGPLIAFGIIGSFVGSFSLPFGTIAAIIGVGMIYAVVIGLITVTFARLAGLAGILISMLLVITVNFPASGASTAAATLPPFWQAVHAVFPGSAMVEWVRGITFFDGAQADRWATQLLIWGAVAALALTAVTLVQRLAPRRRKDAGDDEPMEDPRDLIEDAPDESRATAETHATHNEAAEETRTRRSRS